MRLEFLLAQFTGFAGLVTAVEAAAELAHSRTADSEDLRGRVQQVANGVRDEIIVWPVLVDRLKLVADLLAPNGGIGR